MHPPPQGVTRASEAFNHTRHDFAEWLLDHPHSVSPFQVCLHTHHIHIIPDMFVYTSSLKSHCPPFYKLHYPGHSSIRMHACMYTYSRALQPSPFVNTHTHTHTFQGTPAQPSAPAQSGPAGEAAVPNGGLAGGMCVCVCVCVCVCACVCVRTHAHTCTPVALHAYRRTMSGLHVGARSHGAPTCAANGRRWRPCAQHVGREAVAVHLFCGSQRRRRIQPRRQIFKNEQQHSACWGLLRRGHT